jgi:hypothetical protein
MSPLARRRRAPNPTMSATANPKATLRSNERFAEFVARPDLAVLFAFFMERSDRKPATMVLLQTPVWCE